MIGRVLEVAEDGRHLSVSRGFLVVSAAGAELGRVALDDLSAVIAHGHGMTFSANLVGALTERNVVFVICGSNHRPQAVLWPVDTHHIQTLRMRAQIAARRPLVKRLWQMVVQAKIRQQGDVLEAAGGAGGAGLKAMARRVKSGDPDNLEAQAARRYWPALMGADFRRDTDGDGINALLNYGYAILRAAVARAVMGAGLHPSIGLHHHGRGNPMCLVDDLMEPFRPIVDLAVWHLSLDGVTEVTVEAKRKLAALPMLDMQSAAGISPLGTSLNKLAWSLAAALESGAPALELPLSLLPLEFGGAANPNRKG